MSDFYSRKPVAMWRIVFYGILAAGGVAAVGYFTNDRGLYIAAAFCGGFIGGFWFFFCYVRAKVKPIPGEIGQPARYPAWVRWMFIIGLVASAALKLWDIMHKK